MIQITLQMRILLAVEPADFRKYAERTILSVVRSSSSCTTARVFG